ncbi:MAG: sterol desaturase family protein [Ignavibacteria bacterium]|nr:sterol desaturase family protein [Ignavibacteria bacterium]
MAQKNYVSNKDESARLFQSSFLELFTHVHWSVPLIVFVPVVSYFLYTAAATPGLAVTAITGMFVAGLAVWTLTEYILHRYVFHYEPKSTIGKRLHFLLHGVHHDYPNDSLRLVMPPVVSGPLAALFYFFFLFLVGETHLPPFFAGFLVGYLFYDMIHYATHHAPMKGTVGLLLKHHHMKHHYQTDDYNFGVSSPLWDFVFRTYQQKKESPVGG